MDRLENLYQFIETTTNRNKRNKVILGLFIHQGITTEELHQLEVNHLKLKKGKIYVPEDPQNVSRNLKPGTNPGNCDKLLAA